jgi:hypothetical protein
MNKVGLIWQYTEDPDQSELHSWKEQDPSAQSIPRGNYPLLGRRLELMTVAAQLLLLDEPMASMRRRRDLSAIVFEGNLVHSKNAGRHALTSPFR